MRKRTIAILFVLFLILFSYRSFKLAIGGKEFAFERQVSGCVVAAKPQGTVFSRCTGYHRLEDGSTPTINSQFMIGSVSKQFTTVALLLALNDLYNDDLQTMLYKPISTFLPEDDPIWDGNMPTWANTINLHQLLSHTSGIADYTKSKKFKKPESNGSLFYENAHKPHEIINLIKHKNIEAAQENKLSYSNTNYLLLAIILERLTNTPYEEYVDKKIFKPFHLKNTFATTKYSFKELRQIDPKMVDQLEYDTELDEQKLIPPSKYFHLSNAKGTANVISTPKDLIRWFNELHIEKSVLPDNLYKLMHEKKTEHEGYSNRIIPSLMGEMNGYGGRIGTFTTLLLYIPEKQLSIIMMTNILDDPEKTKDWLGYRAISKVYDKYIKEEF